jgi:hypothetical protein
VADETLDVPLTIALAEYEAVREMRRGAHEGSATRFNYFLVVASGGTAVVAGLLGSGGGVSSARNLAALTIGGMVLLIGAVVFVRLVHYRVTGLEYNTALDAMRTYLVRRAPQLRPYMLMPTLDDDVRARMMSRARGWTGLAQTVALVNSVLLAVAVAMLCGWAAAPRWWVAVVAGLLTLALAVFAHRAYERAVIHIATIRLQARLPADPPTE